MAAKSWLSTGVRHAGSKAAVQPAAGCSGAGACHERSVRIRGGQAPAAEPISHPLLACLQLVEAAEAKAYYGLARNYAALTELVGVLMERDNLTGEELRDVLEGKGGWGQGQGLVGRGEGEKGWEKGKALFRNASPCCDPPLPCAACILASWVVAVRWRKVHAARRLRQESTLHGRGRWALLAYCRPHAARAAPSLFKLQA